VLPLAALVDAAADDDDELVVGWVELWAGVAVALPPQAANNTTAPAPVTPVRKERREMRGVNFSDGSTNCLPYPNPVKSRQHNRGVRSSRR
jgi:hypothetical protein